MNAIISLCHFCEVHGPKILFCTQTLRPHEASDSEGEDNGSVTAFSRERVSSLSERLKSVAIIPGGGLAAAESVTAVAAAAAAAHTSTSKDATDHNKVVCEVKYNSSNN